MAGVVDDSESFVGTACNSTSLPGSVPDAMEFPIRVSCETSVSLRSAFSITEVTTQLTDNTRGSHSASAKPSAEAKASLIKIEEN